MSSKELTPFLAALTGLIGVCLAAYFVFINAEVQKKRKRVDLQRLLKAEIKNLERHCRIVAHEITHYTPEDLAGIRTCKYKDGNMLLFDAKESYLLNENLCQDIMQLSLLSRNNDIFIETLVDLLKEGDIAPEVFKKRINTIQRRMLITTELCGQVLENLDEFARSPRAYNKPAI